MTLKMTKTLTKIKKTLLRKIVNPEVMKKVIKFKIKNLKIELKLKNKLGSEGLKRYKDLKQKIFESKNLNSKAVKEEAIRNKDPNYEKNLSKEEYKLKEKQLKDKMQVLGVPEEKMYTLDTISKIEKNNEDDIKKPKNNYFGWDGKILNN